MHSYYTGHTSLATVVRTLFLIVVATVFWSRDVVAVAVSSTTTDFAKLLAMTVLDVNGSSVLTSQQLQQLMTPPPQQSWSLNCTHLSDNSLRQICQLAESCVSADALVSLGNNMTGDENAVSQLTALCPAVLLHQRSCSSQQQGMIRASIEHNQYDHDNDTHAHHRKPSSLEAWSYSLLFVTVISFSSIFALALMPVLGGARFDRIMPALVGLAVGSLSSGAIFHLLPQAFGLLDVAGDHSYLNTGLVVLAGMWLFFMLERIMKILLHYRIRRGVETARLTDTFSGKDGVTASSSASIECSDRAGGDGPAVCVDVPNCHSSSPQPHLNVQRNHLNHDHSAIVRSARKGGESSVASVAWMITVGDGLHNFLDGVSIGAAFSENLLTGVSISLAILCEELPHELGDFAVLLESGLTIRQAVFYNLASALTCYIGLVFGIIIGDFTSSASAVFALAAGMFLYISLGTMLPEMNESAEKASAVSVAAGIKMLLLQNVGVICGCVTLYCLAYFQDSFQL